MSEVMLLGVLRMPYALAMSTEIARRQYHQRGMQAADEIERLREALAEAITCIQDWSAYVVPYYLERHDLHGDVKRLRAVLEATQ